MSPVLDVQLPAASKLDRLLRTWSDLESLPILIIEDSAAVRDLLCAHLRRIGGFEWEVAHDLQQARALIARHPERFFCAVLDLGLCDAPDGQVVDEVLAARIPVIVMSASLDAAVRNSMLKRPIVDYVVKRDADDVEHVAYVIGRIRENRETKVVVADDSLSFCTHLERLLKRYAYQVFKAASGSAVLGLLEQHPDTALVIADVNMAGMDGLELIGHIRKRYRREDLAIVGLSRSGTQGLSAKLLKLGANDFLVKPFQVEEFYCRIMQATNMVGYVRQIRHFATRDFLTGVLNRRQFFDLGENLHANARRGNLHIATAVIDADHFKRINDTHGHHVGDQALKAMARVLVQCLRGTDVVARYGGEEFVCMAVMKSPADASIVFERVRAAIEAIELCAAGQRVLLTASLGVTVDLCEDLDAMVRRADEGVYESKRAGRNRVTHV